jgi:nitronate monooxygenase
MWKNNKISQIIGIDYPILQGPFGGNLSSVELLSCVSNAGGLGGYGAYSLEPDEIVQLDKQIRAATDKPYNINLWVSDTDSVDGGITPAEFEKAKLIFQPYFEEVGIPLPEKAPTFKSRFAGQAEVILHLRPKVFSFIFGIPDADILEQCRKFGIITLGGATTLDEAIALEQAGVDMIVASGFEAGGHRPSFLATAESSVTGTFVLVQLIKEKVKIPVIAAGGIANGKAVAACLALGAEGVQVGTAFLACKESNASKIHRKLLFSDAANNTALSRAFTGRLGRGIANRIAKEVAGRDKDFLPFPLQLQFMSKLREAAFNQERWDLILFWAGQIAPTLKHNSAKVLMESLIKETDAYYNDLKK